MKFRRQAAIGRFVDFFCYEGGLVVEVDGPIHVDRFTVVRFTNAEILSEPRAVQRRILATLSRLAGEGRGEGTSATRSSP